MRLKIAAAFAAGALVAACGSSPSSTGTSQTAAGKKTTSASPGAPPSVANNPFAGKTIRLIAAVSAGESPDLAVRAIAPDLARYLHATVDVVDMPGAGQLIGWNYTAHAAPNGLTIGLINVQGILANRWEKVPNETPNIQDLSYLGFTSGAELTRVVFSSKPSTAPYSSILALLSDHSQNVKYIGSVGDVTMPLLFKAYKVPYTALTSYGDSAQELQGMERGDGDISAKSWGGPWADYASSGKAKPILDVTMAPKWNLKPSVPTIPTLLREDPPASASEKAAIIADASALDAGWGLMGPAGIPTSKLAILRAAIKWSVAQPDFIARSKQAQVSTVYESAAQEIAAIRAGINPTTVATIRQYVPTSTGVAS